MTINQLRILAKTHNKKLVFNRSIFAYQIKTSAFSFSESETAYRNDSKKLCLDQSQINKLASYI